MRIGTLFWAGVSAAARPEGPAPIWSDANVNSWARCTGRETHDEDGRCLGDH